MTLAYVPPMATERLARPGRSTVARFQGPPTTRMVSLDVADATVRDVAAFVAWDTVEPQALTKRCLNCDAALSGRFCADCGQPAKTPARISLGAILHELPHALFHLEHALPHTLVALLVRPGHLVREYLQGKRIRTFSPFTLLFMVAGLTGLVMLTLKMNQLAGPFGIRSGNDFAQRATAAIFKYQAWVRLAFVPVIAIGPTVVLRKRTGLQYGEQIMAATMVTAGSMVLMLLTIPFRWLAYRYSPMLGSLVSSIAELGSTAYLLWAYAQLQDDGRHADGARRWLRSAASLGITMTIWTTLVTLMIMALRRGFSF